MSGNKVAYRYAKSVLEEALVQKSEEKLYKDMAVFLDALKESRDLSLVLSNPVINYDKKFEILKEIFQGHVEKLTINFFRLVCKKGRAEFLVDIAKEFQIQYDLLRNINRASITTAFQIDQDLRKEFIKIVEEGFNKKVDLTEVVNEDLIGGFILNVNDRRLDESIRSKLNRLRLDLIDQSYKAKI